MQIANIILAHKNPLQLERLLRKMQHPNSDFYVHIDKKADINAFKYLEEMEGVKFIRNRFNCSWGGYSTLRAMLSSLRESLSAGTPYGFYNLLSGQDYPIKSNDAIYQFFTANEGRSFIYYEDEHSAWWDSAVYRFQRYHLTDFNFRGKTLLEGVVNSVLPIRKFPFSMKLYGGSKSSWWSLSPESARYIDDFFVNDRKLNKFLKFCWGTDEFVIPTILMNSSLRDTVVNDNKRYIDFQSGMAHPRVLDVQDIPGLLASPMLFARKFDIATGTAVLDLLDEKLQG